ncbi:hypothetical protein PBY51_011463 [Eleginops maclovinus]|uniref:Tripartite motif-containing protein 66 n=1 Tax=Eleginops maclovinus TaxID=56733 RepID=A0AAN7XU75_ELEMC|nr:hypothetical protein PBY51_011463 [Eleginops maclovinus]
MAHLPLRRHGNFPKRRATLLPRVTKSRANLEDGSSETGSAEKPCHKAQHFCSSGICNGNTRAVSPSCVKIKPEKDGAILLKGIRIHPEAQRILGNSSIPVVLLERLNIRSLSCLQPVVSLVRLPCRTQAELHNNTSCSHPQQNGISHHKENILEIKEESPQSDLIQTETNPTSWTEPYCPDISPSREPEGESGFDCDSNPDQPYILFDSGSEEWDLDEKTETFYLDPDPEPTLVIELDPGEPEAEPDLEIEDEVEIKCEEVQVDISEDLCCSQEEEEESLLQKPGPAEVEEMESEDFCGVCLNGGELLCCDRCPKVFHLICHIPPLTCFPLGDWVCTLCRTEQDPAESYACEKQPSCGGVKAPYTLSPQDQRRCEKLTLLLYCHTLSAPFHEPVSTLARNYYQIIRRPIDLSLIRRKLDKSNTLHYFSAEQFVDDMLLMFKNCSRFNYPDSEVAQAGRCLEEFFSNQLKEIFPDRMFPSIDLQRADILRICRRRKEDHRKRRHVFSGKKYYL